MSGREDDLIRRATAGEIEAFELLVRDLQHRLFRFIVALTGNTDDAEDALQETLLRAYRSLHTYRAAASFSTWVHGIALNVTRNWIRSQSRASSERIGARLVAAGIECGPEPDREIIDREKQRVLRDALLQLPEHYREALLLRHYQDMAYEEIAQVLAVPVGTVRSRLAQGRKLLVQRLANTGYFSDLLAGDEDEV